MFWYISEWCLSPLSAESRSGVFSDLHHENMVHFLEVRLMKVGEEVSMTEPPQEFLTLRLEHTEPPAICQFRFPYPALL